MSHRRGSLGRAGGGLLAAIALAAALALPAVMPLPPTREMRSLADSAQLALDARMGRPTSIRVVGLATYRESLSASTLEAVSPPHTGPSIDCRPGSLHLRSNRRRGGVSGAAAAALRAKREPRDC